jgi:hypothetical protein
VTTKTKKWPLLLRIVSAWPRLFLSILAGFAVGALLPLYVTELRGVTRFLVAWDIGVGLYLILAFWMIAHSGVRDSPAIFGPGRMSTCLLTSGLIIAVIVGIGVWKFAPMFIRIETGIPRLLVAWNVAGRHGPNPGSYAPLYALLIDDHGVVVPRASGVYALLLRS